MYENDLRDNPHTVADFEVPDSGTSEIDFSGDVDAIRVQLVAGQQYIFSLQGSDSGGGTLEDPFLTLLNGYLELVAWDDDSGTGWDSLIVFTPSETGTYYLGISAFGEGTGTYTLTTSTSAPVAGDVAASMSTGSELTLGMPETGVIDYAGDQDWHAVYLTAGQSYRVDLQGSGGSALPDTVLRVFDPLGALIAYNDDTDDDASGSPTDSQITFTASYTGYYYVSAGGYESLTGSYSVQVSSISPSDFSEAVEYYLPPDSEFQGAINFSGDEDVVTLTLVSNQYYVLTATGLAGLDTVLTVYDSTGNVVAFNDDFGDSTDSLIDFYTETSGTYYLVVSGYGTSTGTYSIGSYLAGTDYVGSSGADYVEGGIRADYLDGADGDDTLLGGGGDDVLTGGAGNDLFLGTAADFNGDTIVDFSSGDQIIIRDADPATFTWSRSGDTFTYSGGSMTLAGTASQSVQVTAAEGGGVAIEIVTQFGAVTHVLSNFGAEAGSWLNNDLYPRMLADVNGDGLADIVGFGEGGVYTSLATGGGTFAAATLALPAYGAGAGAGGWASQDRYPRMLADVNGDGRADLIGFGEAGVYTALGTATGTFAPSALALAAFGAGAQAGGWSSDDRYPRQTGDVNGDGYADIVGFGEAGVYVALGTADGSFAPSFLSLGAFGSGAGAGGWTSQDRYPRMLADVNGDSLDDIVAFGEAGTYVSLATGGGYFATPTLAIAGFGAGASAGGWASDDRYPRELADVNGDGFADIIGFGEDGVILSLGNGDGTFAPSVLDIHSFGAGSGAGGWSSDNYYPREVADVNGDGFADVVGFGNAGVYVALSNGDILI